MEDRNVMEKITGWLLLLAGLLVIVIAAFSAYQVFTNKMQPVHLATFTGVKIDLGKFVEQAPPGSNLTQELISPDALNRPVDLAFHLLLMGFLSTIGFKISSLGVMLLRTIKVKLREDVVIPKSVPTSTPPSFK